MGPLYTQYLNDWESQGGGLFEHFVNVGEWLSRPPHPPIRFQRLLGFMRDFSPASHPDSINTSPVRSMMIIIINTDRIGDGT
jgi:hypothetical protein